MASELVVKNSKVPGLQTGKLLSCVRGAAAARTLGFSINLGVLSF